MNMDEVHEHYDDRLSVSPRRLDWIQIINIVLLMIIIDLTIYM